MSSDSESTRYTLYKEGTARLVRWLVRTVSNCSIAFVNAPVKDTHSTADLTRYASAILAAIPPADIPSSIIELVNDVIVGRSVCADWYSSRAAKSSTDQSELRAGNRSHRHFIQVLQEVRDTLREAKLRRSRDGPSRPASDETTSQDESAARESLSNMFERLDLEDTPDDSFSDAEVPTPKPRTGDSTGHHKLLELDDKAEREFALWCFLEDLHEAKLFVKQTWNEYLAGQLSYLAATAITEAAFGVMRRADLVFSTTNPELSNSVAIYRRLGICVGKRSPRDATVNPQAEASEGDISPVADYLCPTGHLTLIDYFNIWGELQHDIGTLQDTREAALPSYVASSFERKVTAFDRRKFELIEKHCTAYNYHPFMPILMETVFDVGALSRYKGAIPWNQLDEFLRGLLDLLNTASVPMWMCVACDCYMSICDALLGELDIGTMVLHDTVAHSKAIVTDYVTLVKNHRANYPTDSLAWLESRINEERTNFRIMKTSSSADDRLLVVQMSLQLNHHPDAWEWMVHRDLPLRPGKVIFFQKYWMTLGGTEVMNHSWAPLSLAHLYRALKHYKLTNVVWEDMEWFLETHNKHSKLMLDVSPNADPLVLIRYFELAIGMPLRAVSKKRGAFKPNDISPNEIRKNQKVIDIASELLRAERDRRQSDIQLGFSRGDILELSLKKLMLDREAKRKGNSKRTGKETAPVGAEVTGIQLLQFFKELTIADEPQMNFNYIGFWVDCAKLVAHLRQKFNHLMHKDFRKQESDAMIVGDLLFEAGCCTKASRKVESTHIAKAAVILEEFLAREGSDKFIKPALEMSSGHIPERNRPHARKEEGRKSESREEIIENGGESEVIQEQTEQQEPAATISEQQVADDGLQPDIRKVYDARKKPRGRRLLRTRK